MSQPDQVQPPKLTVPALTADELVRRRRRSVALATVLTVLAVLFYVVTLVKTGPINIGKPS
jgi:hypothetical protein